MNEQLDFCRVKKISEKGFGFLKSLYYPGDVFFHFSQITQAEFLEKLQSMKRGDFFLFFTSAVNKEGKRNANRIWYSLEAVPGELIPSFIERIILEFNDGSTNIFDLIHIFNELRKIGAFDEDLLSRLLSSKKLILLPQTILPHLDKKETKIFDGILRSHGKSISEI